VCLMSWQQVYGMVLFFRAACIVPVDCKGDKPVMAGVTAYELYG
jgi:hypothetical protein